MSRKTKRTRARDKRFFEALEQGATIGEAAKNAGYSRRSIYDYAAEDQTFSQHLENAKYDLIEKLEKEADRRAIDGVVDYKSLKVTQDGKTISKIVPIRRYSDSLLQFRLRRLDPKNYRENYKEDDLPDDFDDLELEDITQDLGSALKAFLEVETNDEPTDNS
ncbi:hypothetical protein ACSHDS_002830 [Vibrio alginolyticus]|uniref:hypothetical protein n=1 Tax=Vibrio parahaemolyticus TaxID=670 RepID=UPI001E4987A7|nr:hypothetical protein [Vibrio parahaemolyticus]MCD1413717.1 hypothetical protein [Vibrio parahaemolyticus]